MEHHPLRTALAIILPIFALLLLFFFYCYHPNHPISRRLARWRRRRRFNSFSGSLETGPVYGTETEGLLVFPGGENLTVSGILEAPGEVVGKSGHSTLYRASLTAGPTGSGPVCLLLRFMRPGCANRAEEMIPMVRFIGSVRHPNLVPLRALYIGPRGEKLFVHPFYAAGTLERFLKEGVAEEQRWDIICKISIGIARGLDYLHTGLPKPIIHGNLKTNNILLDSNFQPRLSDFGLHLLLNPSAAQEMLESSASLGYKSPELIKMREASTKSDIYSFGVVLLEMVAQKEESLKEESVLQSEEMELRVPSSFKDLVLERKISNAFGSEFLKQSKGSGNEEGVALFFRLAMSCCSPSPVLRPDIKSVLRRLEEIVR